MLNANYRKTYNSFSGVDMNVVIGTELIGEVQGISYTITREKAPLYTMGSADPRSFSRGKRGIAGSMIFQTFDRSALLSTIGYQDRSRYAANEYEVRDEFRGPRIGQEDVNQLVGEGVTGSFGVANRTNLISATKVLARPQYPDQILPFQVSITAANEYGHVAQMHILNIEIMNSGTGMSVDDISLDESCTFVATQVLPWSNQRFILDKVVDTSGKYGGDVGLAGGGRVG